MSVSSTKARDLAESSFRINTCQRLTNGAGYYLNKTKNYLTNGISNGYWGTIGKFVNFDRDANTHLDIDTPDLLGGNHELHSSITTLEPPDVIGPGPITTKAFSARPIATYLLSFLNPRELAIANNINRYFHKIANSQNSWKYQYEIQKMRTPLRRDFKQGRIPELGPAEGEYKRIVKEWYPNMFGKDAYYDHIKGLKSVGTVPPIPASYTPRPGFKLMLILKELEIEIDANITLNEKGRLIENTSSSKEESKEETRVLKVPVTLNNINFLFKNCSKNGTPIKFTDYSWPKLLEDHGDTPVSYPYWSHQKTELIGLGLPYAGPGGQEQLAQSMGLVVAPLIDRVLLNFLTFVSSGEYLDGQNPWRFARTSTVTYDSSNTPRQSGCGAGGLSGLLLDDSHSRIDDDNVGAGAALPAEV